MAHERLEQSVMWHNSIQNTESSKSIFETENAHSMRKSDNTEQGRTVEVLVQTVYDWYWYMQEHPHNNFLVMKHENIQPLIA